MSNKWKNLASLAVAIAAVFAISTFTFASDPVGDLIDKVLKVVQEEKAKPGSTVQDPVRGELFVGASATRVAEVHEQAAQEYDASISRSPEERTQALNAIHQFAEDSTLEIRYDHTRANPNLSSQQVELYETTQAQYLVDSKSNTVRQMITTDPDWVEKRSEEIKTPKELKSKAFGFLETRNPCFNSFRDQLAFTAMERAVDEEGVEDEYAVFFYRWEQLPSTVELAPGDLPPFVQVGIGEDGRIASYFDTVCP